MTRRIGNRFPLSRVASTAVGETELAVRAAPNVIRHLAPIVAWAVTSIALGVVLGLSAVILPPMGAFAIVAVAAVVLLWVMPDLPLVSPQLIRRAFFVMMVADLIVPFYYMVQFSGLPWISARRVATFCLIVPFLVAVAASSDVRRQIMERGRASLLIFICAAGFLATAAVSILTSVGPSESFSAFVDAILSWYVPFFAMIYIARDKNDAVFLLKIVCLCAVFNTGAGVVEFFLKHRFFIDIFPKGMLATMIENNPTLATLLPRGVGDFRNGLFRASSTFVTPLSFGEFEIILIPIGLFFLVHREILFERVLGGVVAFGGIVGIFCSGSRGGFVGVIASVAVFVAFYSIRQAMTNKASLTPAIAAMVGFIGFGCVIALINLSHSFHDTVLGGAAQASSTDMRYMQWAAGIPAIKSNPITGHGFAQGGQIIGMGQDSYILSLVLETGILGFVFFVGLLVLPVWYGLRNYLSDMSESGALAGALACSFIGFFMNRLVLSQKENHMLIFSLLAIVIVLNHDRARQRAPQELPNKSPRNRYYRAGSISPGGG